MDIKTKKIMRARKSVKFKNVGIDDDTKLLSEQETKIKNYETLFQSWKWDGVYGESIIFDNNDVNNLSKSEIKELVKNSKIPKKDDLTISRGKEFTFVNFNFVSE